MRICQGADMGKKIVVDFIKKHWFSYFPGVIFMFLSSYIQNLLPKVLGNTVDILSMDVFCPADVYVNIVSILLIAAGAFICAYIWRRLVMGNARSLECHLREKLFDHIQKLPPEFYTGRKTGNLVAYAINDINAVRQTLGFATSLAIRGTTVCLISVYSMVKVTNWQMTVLSLLPVPVIILIMISISKAVKMRFRTVQKTFASITDRINENINGIRVIKAYVQEDKEVEKFCRLNDQMLEANMSMVRVSSFLSPSIEICFSISFVLNLILGGRMVLQGSISLGDFVAFNGYLTLILAPVISIGRVITTFQRGIVSLGRLDEILNTDLNIKNEGPIETFPEDCSIDLRDLSFAYPGADQVVLNGISVHIPAGKTLGIIGKTGAGKSALVNLLLRLYEVESGKISIGDIDINDFRLGSLRGNLGFVPQDNFLFSASIRDNITFFKNTFSQADMEQAARASCIYDDILDLPDGFETVLGERGVNLSGGQKQRIALARALVKNPEILVLDDALSSVDTVTQAEIIKNIEALRKNKTTIIVSHRTSAIMHADDIIVLDQGSIAERGSHLELIAKGGLYRDFFDAENRCEN
jgi:ATP-binding cassette subfamily B protein